ncbi:MAG TPA: DNA topoisomerase III [Candidatus Scybalocola faecipullorum]|nr:DNA topoisomerase III [Candidatus Scybalocola faecipullorum]
MKSLVIAEKPSVGKDIARVLKCAKASGGGLEGEKYVVVWALGHLVTLADPESYSDDYKEWKMESLPMMPEKMKLEVIRKTGRQYQIVKTQLFRKDISEIIIATDAGREGELVARWILEKAGVKKPIRRLWISSVTDRAIKDGFAHLKNGHDYDRLYEAAKARAEADWLVGLNATRALTVKYNAQLSCGRVQTPTLAIIEKYYERIKNFKPQKYYGIEVVSGKMMFVWHERQSKNTRIFNKEKAEQIIRQVQNGRLDIVKADKKRKKVYAPQLYDLTQLQRDANRLYNFSAKETLNYMQRLYEHYKVLTYPRTDSRYLTSDMTQTLAERVRACSAPEWSAACAQILKDKPKASPRFVNDAKVGDHHAIIPTEQGVRLSELDYGERKIYELVVKRFLAVLMPPYEYDETSVQAQAGGELFEASGRHTVSLGWRSVGRDLDAEEMEKDSVCADGLETLTKGSTLDISDIRLRQGETKPPAPMTEAGLLSAMEHPAGYMDHEDSSLAKTLGETGGLGTVATRADIIEKLIDTGMIEKRDKYLYLTSKGRQVISLAPEELRSPELTAVWEQKLADIASGKIKKADFESQIRSYTSEIVEEIRTSGQTYRHDNITGKRCPQCGKLLLEVTNKGGRSLMCQDRNCGYRRNLSKTTNARCPQCHKRMSLVGEGEGRRFVCTCGYREKLSSFNERKKEAGGKVSKRDVAAYMRKQEKEAAASAGSALADALKKIKL